MHPRVALNVRRTEAIVEGTFDVPLLGVVMGIAAGVALSVAAPVPLGLSLATLLGCFVHLVAGRPAFRVARNLANEHKRLRAAMTCPYCRDHLPETDAMVCDRDGCGAFYHEECWDECRASYGGCAIYGCGCGSAHLVGRFALQRRVVRLLLAAALFPPKVVKRLRESEAVSLRDVWRRSRAYQEELSQDSGRTLRVGLVNLALSLALTGLLVGSIDLLVFEESVWVLVAFLGVLVVPVVFMRVPLAGHFTWFLSRAVASVFRAELAALSRADEGTFLARLVAGAGKKD